MLQPLTVAIRRAMRRHQKLPPRGSGIALWRLVGGELLWALRQLVLAPWVLAGLVAGFAATLGVLDSAAPGPVLHPPWRILVAIAAGMLLASAARGIQLSAHSQPRPGQQPEGEPRPLTAAAIIGGSLTSIVLIIWLLAWAVTYLS